MFEEFTIAESMARVGSYKKHYPCWIQEKNEQHNIYVIKNVALFLYRKAVGSQENKVFIKINWERKKKRRKSEHWISLSLKTALFLNDLLASSKKFLFKWVDRSYMAKSSSLKIW